MNASVSVEIYRYEFGLHLDPSDQIDPKFIGNG